MSKKNSENRISCSPVSILSDVSSSRPTSADDLLHIKLNPDVMFGIVPRNKRLEKIVRGTEAVYRCIRCGEPLIAEA